MTRKNRYMIGFLFTFIAALVAIGCGKTANEVEEELLPELSLRQKDSLALVAMYLANDGENWTNAVNEKVYWNITKPLSDGRYWPQVITEIVNGELRVVALNFTNRKMKGTLPEEIGYLTELRSLDMSYNQLTGKLPESFAKLTKLEGLYLQVNEFDAQSVEFLKEMTRLKIISIENNQFHTLPEEIGNLSQLEYLHLENNRFTRIPAGIGKLTNLTYLNAAENKLTGFPEEAGSLQKLKRLFIGHNQLTTFPACILKMKALFYLGIERNNIKYLDVEAIKNSLPTLEHFDYEQNN